MTQQHFAGFAVFVALAFMALALCACANSGQQARLAAVEAAATPEFHGAAIGGDALRSRIHAD